MTVQDIVLDACLPHVSDSFYVQGEIPKKAIRNINERFDLLKDHEILAVLDTTVFRSAKLGAVLTDHGIHVLNSWTGDMKKGFIDWDLFQYADFESTNKFSTKEVWIDNVQVVMAGSGVTPRNFHNLLIAIQTNLREYNNLVEPEQTVTPPPLPNVQWMVTIKGKQYGPYEEEVVNQMIQNGQLNSQKDYAWKQGMSEWQLVGKCSAFKNNVPPAPPLVPPTPPVSTESAATNESYERVNVNDVQLSELLSLPFMNLQKANDLLLYMKNCGGNVKSIDELREVLQLEPHAFEELKKYLFVTSSSAPKEKQASRGRVVDY